MISKIVNYFHHPKNKNSVYCMILSNYNIEFENVNEHYRHPIRRSIPRLAVLWQYLICIFIRARAGDVRTKKSTRLSDFDRGPRYYKYFSQGLKLHFTNIARSVLSVVNCINGQINK